MAKIIADPVVRALAEHLGLDVNCVRRLVIDLQPGRPPVVHIEQLGDNRLLSVVRALEGVEIKREEG